MGTGLDEKMYSLPISYHAKSDDNNHHTDITYMKSLQIPESKSKLYGQDTMLATMSQYIIMFWLVFIIGDLTLAAHSFRNIKYTWLVRMLKCRS